MNTIVIHNLSALESAAAELIEQIGDNKIIAFYGPMGAGKTTLISELCQQLGVIDRASSPSFSIVNQYQTDCGQSVYHFDFYRIKNHEEAFDFGYEEYLYSGDMCLIEWPEMIEELLPENTLRIEISLNDANERLLRIIER